MRSHNSRTDQLLLGGDILTARIRYEPDALIHRTQLFCTSDNYPFPVSKPFNDRIISYMWRSCIKLNDIIKIASIQTTTCMARTKRRFNRKFC